jgi:DNA-binding transcriptional regulator YiaG
MRFAGRMFKADRFWAIEIPILGVATQGRTRAEACDMVVDALETLVHRRGFRAHLHRGTNGYIEVSANDPVPLVALLLRRLRARHHLSLCEVARRLGATSHNAYARYEQGASIPTVAMLHRLIQAVSPEKDFVLSESRSAS